MVQTLPGVAETVMDSMDRIPMTARITLPELSSIIDRGRQMRFIALRERRFRFLSGRA